MKSRVAGRSITVAVKTAADHIVDFLEVCLVTERCVFVSLVTAACAR